MRRSSSATKASRTGCTGRPPKASRQSPIGPVFEYAADEGYTKKADPFHGYYFRILTAQGPAAPGGAKSYIVDGKMTGGFAFVAYPAEYHNSGVMTFVVNLNGAIYEKDLGRRRRTWSRR